MCNMDVVHKGPDSNQNIAIYIFMTSNDHHNELQVDSMFVSRGLRQFRDPIGEVFKSKLWLSLEVTIELLLTNNVSKPRRNMIPNKFVAPV